MSSERRAFAERVCPAFVDSAIEVAKRAISAKVDVNLAGEEFNRASNECREQGLGTSASTCLSSHSYNHQSTSTISPNHTSQPSSRPTASGSRTLSMQSCPSATSFMSLACEESLLQNLVSVWSYSNERHSQCLHSRQRTCSRRLTSSRMTASMYSRSCRRQPKSTPTGSTRRKRNSSSLG